MGSDALADDAVHPFVLGLLRDPPRQAFRKIQHEIVGELYLVESIQSADWRVAESKARRDDAAWRRRYNWTYEPELEWIAPWRTPRGDCIITVGALAQSELIAAWRGTFRVTGRIYTPDEVQEQFALHLRLAIVDPEADWSMLDEFHRNFEDAMKRCAEAIGPGDFPWKPSAEEIEVVQIAIHRDGLDLIIGSRVTDHIANVEFARTYVRVELLL